jgi:hypothetical protein
MRPAIEVSCTILCCRNEKATATVAFCSLSVTGTVSSFRVANRVGESGRFLRGFPMWELPRAQYARGIVGAARNSADENADSRGPIRFVHECIGDDVLVEKAVASQSAEITCRRSRLIGRLSLPARKQRRRKVACSSNRLLLLSPANGGREPTLQESPPR